MVQEVIVIFSYLIKPFPFLQYTSYYWNKLVRKSCRNEWKIKNRIGFYHLTTLTWITLENDIKRAGSWNLLMQYKRQEITVEVSVLKLLIILAHVSGPNQDMWVCVLMRLWFPIYSFEYQVILFDVSSILKRVNKIPKTIGPYSKFLPSTSCKFIEKPIFHVHVQF